MWINNSLIGELVFDETPYKAYWAKIDGAHNLKTLCFDEGGNSVYKGEMTINFICYEPRAHSTFKFLNEYKSLRGSEWEEWKDSVHLWESDKPLVKINNNTIIKCETYNPGDYKVYPDIEFSITAVIPFRSIRLRQFIPLKGNDKNGELILDCGIDGGFSARRTYKFKIDTKTKIVYCLQGDSNIKEGVFNKYISSWLNRKESFGIIPYTQNSSYNSIQIALSTKDNFNNSIDFLPLEVQGGTSTDSKVDLKLKYNYYYK
jgi:hypothetical protein